MSALFNVYAVRLDDYSRRLIAEGKSEANADAIVQMCVMRRGCDEEIFIAKPAPNTKDAEVSNG